jgi:hypothetical protein
MLPSACWTVDWNGRLTISYCLSFELESGVCSYASYVFVHQLPTYRQCLLSIWVIWESAWRMWVSHNLTPPFCVVLLQVIKYCSVTCSVLLLKKTCMFEVSSSVLGVTLNPNLQWGSSLHSTHSSLAAWCYLLPIILLYCCPPFLVTIWKQWATHASLIHCRCHTPMMDRIS